MKQQSLSVKSWGSMILTGFSISYPNEPKYFTKIWMLSSFKSNSSSISENMFQSKNDNQNTKSGFAT